MASLRLVFLTKSDPDSGNFNTARRICEQLVATRPSWKYKIVPVSNGCQREHISSALSGADVLLCLHLYRCAAALRSAADGNQNPNLPPLIGIAGGTDLNVDSRHPERRDSMRQFIRQCRHVVVFSESMRREVTELMGEGSSRVPVTVIPQGISCQVLVETGSPLQAGAEKLVDRHRYFIILGRIRPVKNCCSILEPFRRWSEAREASWPLSDRVRLLFVGDIEDSEYGEDFKLQLAQSPDGRLLNGVQHGRALQLMQNSLGLINCSLSEGQSNSILEAMSLGVPVIASAIPGNLDIVQHLQTGFIFQDEHQLLQWLDVAAAQDAEGRLLVSRITDTAKRYVQERHSIASEQRAYAQLIADCCERSALAELA